MAPALLEVTREIKLDHDNVRDLFSRYQSAIDRTEKAKLANTLVREMAIHGDAEEISVYNDYSNIGLADTAAHNKEEHAEIKRLVYEADSKSLDDPDYDEVITRAVNTFLVHAKEEEDVDHHTIREKLSAEDNDKVARAFLKARTKVPTRPHPLAPQTGGIAQKAAGLQAGIHDKVVETIGGREFVQLKYTHPDI